MEVEIISTECIKPSSPTPPNLRTHKLSLLDQFVPSVYIPVILFYPVNQSTGDAVADLISQRRQLLKQSLSETLTHFYPFAGRIIDNLSIDCSDEGGVDYLEARVNCILVDYLNQPDPASLLKFLAREGSWKEPSEGDPVAMVQVNIFACGGIAIGVLVCHMIADGTAMSVFLKGWAATARKACHAVCPNFEAPSIFIQSEAYPKEATMMALTTPFLRFGKCTTRRIAFDASAIASLQANASSSSVRNPTRVEVVSALLWKCITAALQAKSGIKRPTFITHAVNLRPRSIPAFTNCTMGNLVWTVDASCEGEETDLPCMVNKIKEAIKKINADFVKNLQGDEGFSKLCQLVKTMGGALSSAASTSSGMDYACCCISWCNFGLYDVDFGWEKPRWVSSVGSSNDDPEHLFPNTIILMDTRSTGGIEAWVCLDKDDMTVLGQDKELLAFASLDPSPLN
ncbi:Vinorine synthase [Morella rubra]|uniref:Vinorine synthase n=1 Tax=Morella rubra TaxID=262757 RepID=A0A6A1UUR7_9ROSI|nr:Vinorine synthase [Morella rubra]